MDADEKPAPAKRTPYWTRYKEKAEAEIARLRAQVAAQGVAAPEPAAGGYDPALDPLRAITAATRFVDLVGTSSTYYLRPSMAAFYPPLTEVSVSAHSQGPWKSCPFDIGSRDRVEDENAKVMLAKWWKIRLTREIAFAVHSDARWPCPTEAVVAPADFGGIDHTGTVTGRYTRLPDEVPLREIVRKLLQNNPGTLFLLWGSQQEWFDPRWPNPYGNFVEKGQKAIPVPDRWPETLAPAPAYPGQVAT